MKILIQITIILLLCFSCSSTKPEPEIIEEDNQIERTEENNKSNNLFIEDAEPFYPIKETVEDIQSQVNELRSRMIDYEERIASSNLNSSISKLVQIPQLQNEILMNNGTLIQGTILSETIESIIIQTQIGQLTIDKADINNIKEIASIDANVVFTNEPKEKINANYHIYSGAVQNQGLETASFIRIIFKLWSSETDLIAIDSAFVDGSQIVYHSGINTDTALKPGESGEYVVNVKTPVNSNVQYITRDIHWELYK
tara:strand:+ start:155 stop:922 length:768 start_codon:yes stop_codon:yes gene_type:complete